MPGRAKSETAKQRARSKAHEDLMLRAVEVYRQELQKPHGLPRRGARTVCRDFEALHVRETGKLIKLSYSTLIRLAEGGQTRAEASAKRSWLTSEEVDAVITYAVELAHRGFPLSHRRLKEHVDKICRTRLGSGFPAEGVGKKWTHRFVEKYSERLKVGWSTPLESKRGRAVNPNTHKAWYSLLGDTLTRYEIASECTYGVDECGIQAASGETEWVIGGRTQGQQYQQRDGNRETMTVLVTICADGTSTPPAVIFKGAAYQARWKQDNPANAS